VCTGNLTGDVVILAMAITGAVALPTAGPGAPGLDPAIGAPRRDTLSSIVTVAVLSPVHGPSAGTPAHA